MQATWKNMNRSCKAGSAEQQWAKARTTTAEGMRKKNGEATELHAIRQGLEAQEGSQSELVRWLTG
jgi:hypothetical protein